MTGISSGEYYIIIDLQYLHSEKKSIEYQEDTYLVYK